MLVAAVELTTLRTVCYDEARQLLQLEFRGGAIYQYFDVPAAVHQVLLDAPSKGRCFVHTVRGKFAYRRIPERTADAVDVAITVPDGR
jgi:hypothetical protein